MPGYEMSMIYKILERPQLVKAIRRTADAIIERGGIIKSMENVGPKNLPHKMFVHRICNENGHYYLIKFHSPPDVANELLSHLKLDMDIIKRTILREEEMVSRPCEHRDCDFGELTLENRKRLNQDIKNFIKKI